MIPFKTINCSQLTKDAKILAIRNLQQTYKGLEDEIIDNNAIVVIDFMNRYDLTWHFDLQNAPKYLIDKFKKLESGDGTQIMSLSPEF